MDDVGKTRPGETAPRHREAGADGLDRRNVRFDDLQPRMAFDDLRFDRRPVDWLSMTTTSLPSRQQLSTSGCR